MSKYTQGNRYEYFSIFGSSTDCLTLLEIQQWFVDALELLDLQRLVAQFISQIPNGLGSHQSLLLIARAEAVYYFASTRNANPQAMEAATSNLRLISAEFATNSPLFSVVPSVATSPDNRCVV